MNADRRSTQSMLQLISDIQASDLNAYIYTDPNKTIAMLQDSERYCQSNKPRALEGLPIAIKDLFCVKGTPTTAASKMLKDFIAPYESTVTQRLWDQGAIFTGKVNLDAFGMGSHNTYSIFGPTLNPISRDGKPTSAGGSSGGSAAAVAAGLAWAALGTDTGGSCRLPAAFTGIVGLKPTYGLCSRYGVIAHASSLDCPGVFANSVKDTARVLQVIAGYDERDAQTFDQPVPDFVAACTGELRNYKIAYCDMGTEITLPIPTHQVNIDAILEHAVECYMVISTSEACSNMSRYDGIRYGYRTQSAYTNLKDYYCKTRSEGFGDETKRRILLGAYALSDGSKIFHRANQMRQWIADEMAKFFAQYDVLLLPTATFSAPTLDSVKSMSCNEIYNSDKCTVTPSLIGGVAISIPIGLDEEGMPMGMQVVGPPFSEAKVLEVASALEQIIERNKKIIRRDQ